MKTHPAALMAVGVGCVVALCSCQSKAQPVLTEAPPRGEGARAMTRDQAAASRQNLEDQMATSKAQAEAKASARR